MRPEAAPKKPPRKLAAAAASLVPIGVLVTAGFAIVLAPPERPLRSAPNAITEAGEAITVVDGDTVDIAGARYRLQGFDAPEIYHAKCGQERDRGLLAAARLIALLRDGQVRVRRSHKLEKWGRGLARISVAGRDVSALLIAEGHARAYDGKSRRPGWCR